MKFIRRNDGTYISLTDKETRRLIREGEVIETPDGYHFARANVPVLKMSQGEPSVSAMRWDLIPHNYYKDRNVSIGEAIRAKNSRAIDPKTGRTFGYSSFNARLETVRTLPAFRDAWSKGQRGLIAVDAFKERPNMDDAPPEFKGREYEVNLSETMFFAALWDKWEPQDKNGAIVSCTVLTMDSKGIQPLESIWHERVPVMFTENECEAWIDPKTTSEQAFKLCRQVKSEKLSVREIVPTTIQEKLL